MQRAPGLISWLLYLFSAAPDWHHTRPISGTYFPFKHHMQLVFLPWSKSATPSKLLMPVLHLFLSAAPSPLFTPHESAVCSACVRPDKFYFTCISLGKEFSRVLTTNFGTKRTYAETLAKQHLTSAATRHALAQGGEWKRREPARERCTKLRGRRRWNEGISRGLLIGILPL